MGGALHRKNIVLTYKNILSVSRSKIFCGEVILRDVSKPHLWRGGYPKTFFPNPIFGGGYLKRGVSIALSGDR